MEWKPIDTASKPDEAPIDLWVRAFDIGEAGAITVRDIGRYVDCYWGEDMHGKEGWLHWDGVYHILVESGNYRATHWMPKPAPPA